MGRTGSKEIPRNHTGARCWPKEISQILDKELACKATIGPFDKSPFGEHTYLSPLNSVPKKESMERRMILDLSYPEGNSINDGIMKDKYVGEESKLFLPSVDQLAEKVAEIGEGAKNFKIDLSRGYRQFLLDPAAVNWLGYVYNCKFLF